MRWKLFVAVFVPVLAMVLPAGVASAQDARVEVSGFVGYTFSEGVDINPENLGGLVLNHVGPSSSFSYGFAVDIFVTEQAQVGFQFGQQASMLRAEGTAGAEQELTDMSVNTYHGTFTYNFYDSRTRTRPFIFAGLGATQYSPSDIMGIAIDGETQFSTTWGAGVKYAVNDSVGIKLMARWTPTYIKSDPGGVWCSPYWGWGCWVLSDTDYSNQFEFAAGMAFRF